jgi:RNA polymerase sigma-70 factor (sigma-E family)
MAGIEFEPYVAGQTGPLLRLAYVLSGDAHTAEDLVQEALLRCHRRWGRVSRMANPDAYVRRAIVNQHLSWRRRRSSSELSVAPELLSAEPASDSQDALAARDLMRRALRQLPRSQRAVLVLRYYEGLADLLGCSTGNVRGLASPRSAVGPFLRTSASRPAPAMTQMCAKPPWDTDVSPPAGPG